MNLPAQESIERGAAIGCEQRRAMHIELKIDRGIYLADDQTRTYRYIGPNAAWKQLSASENEANERAIEGYRRVLRSGKTRTYRRAEHPRAGTQRRS
ncbi:MAG TPA: hypothetical protein VFZ66_13775 [Herpetosiphonaceae bacterium]